MHENNVSHIFLLGFPNLQSFNIPLFLTLLFIYCLTICGNIIIVMLVALSKNLHSPMYLYITQVSLLDILMTTDIVPYLLHILLHNGGSMSLGACILQLYVFGNVETFECLILMVMSFDRYVAICNPLRYTSIINRTFCVKSTTGSWLLSFSMMLTNSIVTYNLDFCGSNIIDHFFCDLPPLVELSCSDTFILQTQTTMFGITVIIWPFSMIIVSYVYIISTILNMKSTGRLKTFYTCSSHLTAVLLFFGSLFSVYMVPTKGNMLSISKALSLLYTVVTPSLNPFIYSLRNKDFKEAFETFLHYLHRLN